MDLQHSTTKDADPHLPQQEQNGRVPFVARIEAGMDVFEKDGTFVGVVGSIERDEIRLAGMDEERPSYVPLSLVDGVEDKRVTLRDRGDNAFGVEVSG